MIDFFPCFEDEDAHNKWMEAALDTGVNPNDPCIDCTVKFQALATKLGLCLFPEKEIIVEEDEEVW